MNSRRRGVTLIEVLAASAIVSVTVVGGVSLYVAMMNMTIANQDGSTSAALARYATERTHFLGFNNVNDGTTTRYYNASGTISSESATQVSSSYYSVATTISSDKTQSSTTGTRISPLALRTVKVVVRRLRDNRVMETWGTYLARSGI